MQAVQQVVIYCETPAATAAAAAPSRDDLYGRAVKERLAGATSVAIGDLQALLAAHPDDVDARLQLGFALRAAGRGPEAEAAFRQVLQQVPTYKDAQVALAQILWERGDVAGAKAALGPALLASPGDAETEDFVKRLTAASTAASQAAKPAPQWRIDETFAYSDLSRGLPAWYENDFAFSRKVDADSAVIVTVQSLQRFKLDETYVEGAYDHGWSGGEWSLAIGGSLNPLFRPKLAVRFDTTLNPWGAASPWRLAFDGSYSQYVAGDVASYTFGVDRLFFGDQGRISARFIGVHDERGEFIPGFSVGGGWRFNDRWDVAGAYVDAGENDTGTTVRVHSIGGTANYTVSDRVILHASVTNEARQGSYDRVEVDLGATAKF
ncbi:MAG TPA: YaiO family outer membrane beta-barrel protein [Caulobacteraceae bacterium]|jgi:YaiO family outer membrane protein